jgi:hypothetical protein
VDERLLGDYCEGGPSMGKLRNCYQHQPQKYRARKVNHLIEKYFWMLELQSIFFTPWANITVHLGRVFP